MDVFQLRRMLLVLFTITWTWCSAAQAGERAPAVVRPSADRGVAALQQALVDLSNDYRLMCVAAHPDDEDVETLTYYRKKHGVETFSLNATRGEGGQNEIGDEIGRALGVIRSFEMERAGTINGARYFNLNLEEFGYSKSLGEAMEKWGQAQALARMVRQIRQLKPHVIITHHDTLSGHGHHRAVGKLALLAFDAAADPAYLPGHGAPWQVRRLLLRSFDGGNFDVSIPVGEYDPVRGLAYSEIGARAMLAHKSQGMGMFADRMVRGERKSWYRLIRGEPMTRQHALAIFDGVQPFSGLAALLSQSRHLGTLLGGDTPWTEDTLPGRRAVLRFLTECRRELDTARASQSRIPVDLAPVVDEFEGRLNLAIHRALGLKVVIALNDTAAVPGQEVAYQVQWLNGDLTEVSHLSARLLTPSAWAGDERRSDAAATLTPHRTVAQAGTVMVPLDAKPTFPREDVFYRLASIEGNLTFEVSYEVQGVLVRLAQRVQLEVLPPHEIEITPGRRVLSLFSAAAPRQWRAKLVNRAPAEWSGRLAIGCDHPGVSIEPDAVDFAILAPDGEQAVSFQVQFEGQVAADTVHLWCEATSSDPKGGSPVRSQATILLADIQIDSSVHVGVVQSYDATITQALDELGISNALISEEEVDWEDLSRFDTIVLDIRAYLVRKDLRRNNSRLLKFVKRGGNLIVNYQKVFEWNSDYGNPDFAPYPLKLGRQRVTREDAPITVLKPEHRFFGIPNQITAADWLGWVQERGLYFPAEWDERYQTLLQCSDPGEAPLKGGLIFANYGLGTYTYTSIVWYRQLRVGHVGALKLVANMVAGGR